MPVVIATEQAKIIDDLIDRLARGPRQLQRLELRLGKAVAAALIHQADEPHIDPEACHTLFCHQFTDAFVINQLDLQLHPVKRHRSFFSFFGTSHKNLKLVLSRKSPREVHSHRQR